MEGRTAADSGVTSAHAWPRIVRALSPPWTRRRSSGAGQTDTPWPELAGLLCASSTLNLPFQPPLALAATHPLGDFARTGVIWPFSLSSFGSLPK